MIQHLCAWSRVSALDDNDVVLTVPARDSAQAPSFSLSKNDHSLSELSVSAIGRVPISRESTAGGCEYEMTVTVPVMELQQQKKWC